MVDDRELEVCGIAEGGAEEAGRLDRVSAVGEGYGAGFLEEAELGDLLAAEATGDCGGGEDIDRSGGPGTAKEEIDKSAVIS